MRLSTARIEPADPDDLDADAAALLARWSPGERPLNIFLTYLRHPKMASRWAPFAAHVFAKSSLPPRDRELLILRTAFLCRSGYEFAHHARVASAGLLDAEEIARAEDGPDAPGWSDFDSALLRAADELHSSARIDDATWDKLAVDYDERQLIDVVFTVGAYTINSMATNSLGIQLEPGVPVPHALRPTAG